MKNKVIWNEGMFLKPQHFQQQEVYLENIIQQKTTHINPNQWGILKLELNHELLATGKVALNKVTGIFQDGTAFNAPDNDLLPNVKEINEDLTDTLVYIGIPASINGSASITLEKNNKTGIERYCSDVIAIKNHIKHVNLKSDVLIAKLNLRILFESEDLAQYHCIPIAKIKQVKADKKIVIDEKFIPPSITISSSCVLENSINEITTLLENRANMIASRMSDTQQSANSEIIDMMILQVVNKYETLMKHTASLHGVHPEYFYRYCLSLYAEMAVFTNNKRRPKTILPYSHKDLDKIFHAAFTQIRECLKTVLEQNATQIELEQKEFGIWLGAINSELISDADEIILVVGQEGEHRSLQQNLPHQIKIAPASKIKDFVSRAIPGVTIEALTVAPRQIPYSSKCTYFRIMKNNTLWQEIVNSKTMALHLGGEYQQIDIKLWAIRD
jgi:type VI secretion system protein ImpJ